MMANPLDSTDDSSFPSIIRPYVSKPSREGRVVARIPVYDPIEIRLVGLLPECGAWVNLLENVAHVREVSVAIPLDDGRVKVYLTAVRRRHRLRPGDERP